MKVFELIEFGCFDYETNIDTKIFATRELAEKEWNNRVKLAIDDANNFLDDDERVIEQNGESLYFDAYKDGYASEWNITISVREKEIVEE